MQFRKKILFNIRRDKDSRDRRDNRDSRDSRDNRDSRDSRRKRSRSRSRDRKDSRDYKRRYFLTIIKTKNEALVLVLQSAVEMNQGK